MPVTISSKGSVTASTPSRSSSCETVSSIAVVKGVLDDLSPSAATTMNWALVPLACGNLRSSCSMPACDSVPGIENELSVPFPNIAHAPPAIASSSTHETSTRHGWRYVQRPSA